MAQTNVTSSIRQTETSPDRGLAVTLRSLIKVFAAVLLACLLVAPTVATATGIWQYRFADYSAFNCFTGGYPGNWGSNASLAGIISDVLDHAHETHIALPGWCIDVTSIVPTGGVTLIYGNYLSPIELVDQTGKIWGIG